MDKYLIPHVILNSMQLKEIKGLSVCYFGFLIKKGPT